MAERPYPKETGQPFQTTQDTRRLLRGDVGVGWRNQYRCQRGSASRFGDEHVDDHLLALVGLGRAHRFVEVARGGAPAPIRRSS